MTNIISSEMTNKLIQVAEGCGSDRAIIINLDLLRHLMEEQQPEDVKSNKIRIMKEIEMLKQKRDSLLIKVRERISIEKEIAEREKQLQLEAEQEAEKAASALDMSEDARLDRAYYWYYCLGMPKRQAMKDTVRVMPPSTGLSAEDVDLLPWSVDGGRISVSRMQKFVREVIKRNRTNAW